MSKSEWGRHALAAITALSASGAELTSDDLLEWVGPPDPEHEPNGVNNAIGSVFREAHAAGLIEKTGRVVKSRQPHRKGGIIQVWRGTNRQGALFG